jgi:hypothetical protein
VHRGKSTIGCPPHEKKYIVMRLKQKLLIYRKNLQSKKQILLKRGDINKFSLHLYLLPAILILSGTTNAMVQNNPSPNDTTRLSQISLLYPLGTEGALSSDYTYKISLNLIAGYCGGVKGLELSGFTGIIKNDVEGAQFAGFGNFVKRNAKGLQMAGFINTVKDTTQGSQLAGFLNYSGATFKGGAQGAGFANVTRGSNEGLQISGFANISKQSPGEQISGFINVSTDSLAGFQMSGFANIDKGDLKGPQIAGFFNYAKTIEAPQIGLFNYSDSVKRGVPIGFISVVKKGGLHELEISSSETLYGIVSFKIGIPAFYNIFSIGAISKNNELTWGWGYGVGTLHPLNEKWKLAVEIISYHLNEDEWHTDKLNLHNKLQAKFKREIANGIQLFGGISWNANITDAKKDGKMYIAPWKVFDRTVSGKTNVIMYPGFSAGISF